jgi:hypothetical protein
MTIEQLTTEVASLVTANTTLVNEVVDGKALLAAAVAGASGSADAANTSKNAIDAALISSPSAAALAVNLGDAGGAGMVGHSGVLNYVAGTLGASLNDVCLNISMFPWLAPCDGVADDSQAINAAVLYLATRKGGTIKWPSNRESKINSPVFVVSNIRYDLNGARIKGQGAAVGRMFETGYLSGSALLSNVGTAYQSQVVKNAKIYGGYLSDTGQAFDFQNFNHGCKIHDIELFNARQFGIFDACFYAHFDTVSHSGGTIETLPSFHFKSANNAIKLNKVITTCAWDYLFEGGSSAITLSGCTQEGGVMALKIKGDMLGLTISGNYAEAITGTWLDLTEAGAVTHDFKGNYFNYVDVVVDDGGGMTALPMFGSFDETNYLANVGGVTAGVTYRALMRVSRRGNHTEYKIAGNNDGVQSIPANWIFSKNSNLSVISTAEATGPGDYRQKSLYSGIGIIPLRRAGDTGEPYPGLVLFTTVASIPGEVTIDTKIAWQPGSLFAKFCFTVQDGNGPVPVYGDVFGANIDKRSASPITVTASNQGGFLRLTLGIAGSLLQITGSVQICS